MTNYSYKNLSCLVLNKQMAITINAARRCKDNAMSAYDENLYRKDPTRFLERALSGKLDWDGYTDRDITERILNDAGVPFASFSEFSGLVQFTQLPQMGIEYDHNRMLFLEPLKEPSLFAAAYESPDALVEEYRTRLGNLIPEKTSIKQFLADIDGTYTA